MSSKQRKLFTAQKNSEPEHLPSIKLRGIIPIMKTTAAKRKTPHCKSQSFMKKRMECHGRIGSN